MNEVIFSQAIDGYLLYAHGRRLSEHTVAEYQNTFRKFQAFVAPDDPLLTEISLDTIEGVFRRPRWALEKNVAKLSHLIVSAVDVGCEAEDCGCKYCATAGSAEAEEGGD